MKSSGIGGQAVMEGIMMKNGDAYAVAVRREDGKIDIEKGEYKSITGGKGPAEWPFIRGPFRFVDSLILGMKALTISASFAELLAEESGTDQEKAEKKPSFWERKLSPETIEKLTMGVAVVLAIFMSVGLFMVLPVFLAGLFRGVIDSPLGIAVLEGVGRVAMFVGYVSLISLMKEIRRLYMYHGAEHKCISCIEAGLPLTVENVRKSSKEHKRCGTSFMLFVMMVSIFVSIFIRTDTLWLRALTRLCFLPVVVSLSYEFIRLAGNSDGFLPSLLSKPGLWLQGLTTKEPDDDMIEVAIAAVETVFDWKSWQEKELEQSA